MTQILVVRPQGIKMIAQHANLKMGSYFEPYLRFLSQSHDHMLIVFPKLIVILSNLYVYIYICIYIYICMIYIYIYIYVLMPRCTDRSMNHSIGKYRV